MFLLLIMIIDHNILKSTHYYKIGNTKPDFFFNVACSVSGKASKRQVLRYLNIILNM